MGRIFDDAWEARALKERMRHTTIAMAEQLPGDFRAALDIIRRASPALGHYGFTNITFSDFVALYGLEDWAASIPALEEFTQRISAEFAVRHFLNKDLDRMMAQMRAWAQHESHHVRRLASEGCRPWLPWGISVPALKENPAPIIPILEQLKDDPEEWVRRSVANNLNDISRNHPEVVVDLLRQWQSGGDEIQWITQHALRGLIKKGHPGALELLGYSCEPAITVTNLSIKPGAVAMGEEVTFAFDVQSTGDQVQNLMIDYVMHYMKANGQQSPKVFKLRKRTITPGETMHITKRHSFKAVSTRKHYPGAHVIEVQINGNSFGRCTLELTN